MRKFPPKKNEGVIIFLWEMLMNALEVLVKVLKLIICIKKMLHMDFLTGVCKWSVFYHL